MNSIDTPEGILGNVRNILNAGYHGIIRYVSPDTADFPDKRLKAAEVAAIQSVPGMRIGLVYENNPVQAGYFSTGQGQNDADDALAAIAALGVPVGTPVFMAIDYDASPADLGGPIQDYFFAAHTKFTAAGRLLGIYGSGTSCSTLIGAGVVHYTWLAESRGWDGYAAWKTTADIIQIEATTVAGLSVDTDFVVNEGVLW